MVHEEAMVEPTTLWQDLQGIRQTRPLIHNITNYVAMNNTANALLALGASPVMAHAIAEVADMVKIASALVVNIGTLSDDWIAAMEVAMQAAKQAGVPTILDPVGVGATPYRTETARKLIASVSPTVIRGNASEIAAIANADAKTKGVDSTADAESVVAAAESLSRQYSSTVVMSGATDFIIDGDRVLRCENGHPLMAKVTGMGCTATVAIAAFLTVNSDSFLAAARGMAVVGIAGEIAGEKASGPGTLQLYLLDALYNLTERQIASRMRLT